MGLESGTTIAQLVSTNPLSSDNRNQGDDHLRLIKAVLKAQFPGALGGGFNIPITASEAELNFVDGVTSSIQAQINAITGASAAIPSGTRMLFWQAAAPTGWTKITTHDNYMLRVVSGTGGGSGGTDSPILMDVVPTHSHGSTIGNASATHTHAYVEPTTNVTVQSGSGVAVGGVRGSQNTGTNSVTHTHTIGVTDNVGVNWTPKYIDTIVCSKN